VLRCVIVNQDGEPAAPSVVNDANQKQGWNSEAVATESSSVQADEAPQTTQAARSFSEVDVCAVVKEVTIRIMKAGAIQAKVLTAGDRLHHDPMLYGQQVRVFDGYYQFIMLNVSHATGRGSGAG
jgi:hypothetical protein